MKIKMKKSDVMAKLKANLKLAEKQDAQDLREYKKMAHKQLMEFRRCCRIAEKWTFEEGTKHDWMPWRIMDDSKKAISCPRISQTLIKDAIRTLEMISDDTYRIATSDAKWDDVISKAFVWEPRDTPKIPQTVCDLAANSD